MVVAAAMVPLAVRKFPDVVRWLGKKIESTGAKIANTADEAERYERERCERIEKEEARMKSASTATAEPKPESTVKSKSMKKDAQVKPPKKERKKADFDD